MCRMKVGRGEEAGCSVEGPPAGNFYNRRQVDRLASPAQEGSLLHRRSTSSPGQETSTGCHPAYASDTSPIYQSPAASGVRY